MKRPISNQLFVSCVGAYHTDFHTVVSPDFKDALKTLDKLPFKRFKPNKEWQAFVTRRKNADGIYCYAVFLKPECNHRTMAHESVHLAAHILGDRGVPFEQFNNEAYAYLIDSIFAQLEYVMDLYHGRKKEHIVKKIKK